jgi:hypothetical protein
VLALRSAVQDGSRSQRMTPALARKFRVKQSAAATCLIVDFAAFFVVQAACEITTDWCVYQYCDVEV